jgi:hypothetical protein
MSQLWCFMGLASGDIPERDYENPEKSLTIIAEGT